MLELQFGLNLHDLVEFASNLFKQLGNKLHPSL